MSVSEIGNLAHQMLQALVFTHDQGVMHRDLKPANILCVSRNRFKLGDFGLATLVGTLVETRGTPQYRAPEVQDLTLYGYPADVFSLGVTLFECLDGLPNYNKPTWHQDLMIDFGRYYRKSRKQRAIMTNAHDSVFIRLVKESILLMKPGERLTARECIEKDRYSWLWTWFSLWEMVDDVEEADVDSLEQMHQDRSFEANSLQSSRLKDLQSSRIEDTGDMTFETISGLKEPLLITLADDNVKRKRESQTSSTPAKDKAEDKTITPNQPTPDISKSPKIDIKPKRGEDDSSITVRAIGSSVREPKRIKFGSI